MKFFQNVLRLMDLSMNTPGLFGWFHLLWLGITAAATVLLCRYGKGKEHSVVLWTSLLVIILEIYKQINYSFSYENGITFDYNNTMPFSIGYPNKKALTSILFLPSNCTSLIFNRPLPV